MRIGDVMALRMIPPAVLHIPVPSPTAIRFLSGRAGTTKNITIPGADSNTNWDGFSNWNWIGFGMQYSTANTFVQTPWGCRVYSYTNPVILPPVTVTALKSDFETIGKDFTVTYRCGGALVNGFINRNAGVGPDKISVAFSTDHPMSGNNVLWSRYALSDNYGQDGYASNVGIGVSVAGKTVGFITNAYTNDYTKAGFLFWMGKSRVLKIPPLR